MSVPLPGTMVGIVTNGMMAGVLMNGMMPGVLLDGTKGGNKRMTLPQAHFRLPGLDDSATSSPKQFQWVKMNLDTGAAMNTFLLNFGTEVSGDGRFYRTASGEWIPDGWNLAIPRIRSKWIDQISESKTHWCSQSFVQCGTDRVQRTTRFQPRTRR